MAYKFLYLGKDRSQRHNDLDERHGEPHLRCLRKFRIRQNDAI